MAHRWRAADLAAVLEAALAQDGAWEGRDSEALVTALALTERAFVRRVPWGVGFRRAAQGTGCIAMLSGGL